jgi:hypothetical protein
MGEFDGVGRVYRVELNPHPDRPPQVERTEKDKRGKEQDAHHDEEPQDKVELHEEEADPPKEDEKAPKPKPKDRKLDISA